MLSLWRNVLIPPGFTDVYIKFSAAFADLLQYKCGQNITLVTIHDCTGVSMANTVCTRFNEHPFCHRKSS